jgi:protein-disulfide isomerase
MVRKSGNGRGSGSSLRGFYALLAAVALLGAGALVVSVVNADAGAAAPVRLDIEDPERLIELAAGVESGDPEAPVTILEFGDYQCPACGAFAGQVKPLLDLNYVEPGKAELVFYDFPLVQVHPNAFLAARAARCAGDQGAYWTYHDRLFQAQTSWSRERSPTDRFVGYAADLGLDEDAFRACLESDRHAETVTAGMRLGERLGVTGTPTLVVSRGDGRADRLPAFDYATVRAAIEDALKE